MTGSRKERSQPLLKSKSRSLVQAKRLKLEAVVAKRKARESKRRYTKG